MSARRRGPSEPLNVWQFTLKFTRDFVNELAQPATTGSPEARGGLYLGATPRLLRHLKLEEYWARVRVHQWLEMTAPDNQEWVGYDWIEPRGDETPIWSFGAPSWGSRFDLVGRWARAENDDRPRSYELVGHIVRPASPEDDRVLLFTVPMNVRVLRQTFPKGKRATWWESGPLLADCRWWWGLSVIEIDPEEG